MKKFYYLATLFLLSLFSLSAQSDITSSITGELISEVSQGPVPQANIRVLQKSDSTFITGKASDLEGRFSIPINNGSYILQISFIGYNDLFEDVEVTSSTPVVRLGKLIMTVDNILLSETVVTAKVAEIVVKGDTLEYNADSYKVTESAVVEDLLKKMPGVEIDTEGNITVNGKAISKILVDGEEFFSNDPKVASKNLPANMVEKLQILERRSEMARMTGFDDGQEENVINLTVRPGMKEGLFGNAFAGSGSKERYEGNVMVNYMKNKDQYTILGGINNTNNAGFSDLGTAMFGSMGGRGGRGGMFGGSNGISTSGNIGGNFSKEFSSKFKLGGNVRYGYTDTDVISDVFTQNILSAGNTLEDEYNRSNNMSENLNIDLRLEWDPNEYTKLIFRPNASIYNNTRTETGEFNTIEELTADKINDGQSDYYSEGKGSEVGGNIDFSRKLGDDGRVISAQFSGNIGNSENNGTSVSETMYYRGTRPNDIIDQRFTNQNDNSSWRGYISYVEPIGMNNFIQLAYQYRQNVSVSDRDTRSEELLGSGNYNVLDSLYSKRLDNNFIRQELELNFQSIREKFDYMVGFSMQPSSSRNKTFIGEEVIDTLRQDVINFAPMTQFNYRWDRNKNLRIRYLGSTNQPSVTQLSPVIDISDPLNIRYGNPDLKPSFEHSLNVRYRSSNPEKASSFNAFANAGYMTNDVVSLTATDISSGRKITTYENIAGNWNANGRIMMNIPFKNIKFSLFSMSFASYNHSNGYTGTYTATNEIVNPDNINVNSEKNLSKRLNLSEVLGLNFRSEQFDFSVRGNVSYNNVTNSLEGQRDQEYFNYGANASTSIYLPLNFTLESDINYSTNSGYADGFQQNEWLWNASLQKTIFKQKNGTIRFKIYDILQQRSNISRSVSSNYIRDTTTNTLTTYFMIHFVYRFNIFKGGATQSDMMQYRRGPDSGHGRM
jgi:hypothetical protein